MLGESKKKKSKLSKAIEVLVPRSMKLSTLLGQLDIQWSVGTLTHVYKGDTAEDDVVEVSVGDTNRSLSSIGLSHGTRLTFQARR
jgi:hypothetical protein